MARETGGRREAAAGARRPVLSAVVPVLDAAGTLPAVLAALEPAAGAGFDLEIVVADGGSRDGSAEVAAGLGARVLSAPRGRGTQLAAGARAARGEWLLFLHADTVLEPGWAAEAAGFAADPRNRERAAVFAFALDDDAPAARRMERIVRWRVRRLGLPYGDQGLLVHRRLHDRLGGHRDWPLMEDVDLARRIGRRRIAPLEARAVTSAARYRRDGWLARPARNLFCLALFLLGVPPRRIARLYG